MQEVDDIIDMLPEESNDEGLGIAPEEVNDEDSRISKIRLKRHNSGTGIYRSAMSFDGNTY